VQLGDYRKALGLQEEALGIVEACIEACEGEEVGEREKDRLRAAEALQGPNPNL